MPENVLNNAFVCHFYNISFSLLSQVSVEIVSVVYDEEERNTARAGDNVKLRLKGVEEEVSQYMLTNMGVPCIAFTVRPFAHAKMPSNSQYHLVCKISLVALPLLENGYTNCKAWFSLATQA